MRHRKFARCHDAVWTFAARRSTNQTPVVVDLPIRNINRTVGTILSSEVTKKYGGEGFERRHDSAQFQGVGRSKPVGFGVHGITVRVEGDVNDYCGKGLSGGRLS